MTIDPTEAIDRLVSLLGHETRESAMRRTEVGDRSIAVHLNLAGRERLVEVDAEVIDDFIQHLHSTSPDEVTGLLLDTVTGLYSEAELWFEREPQSTRFRYCRVG